MSSFRLICALLWEVLFPSGARCMGCGAPAGTDEEWLCEDCLKSLKKVRDIGGAHCKRCGAPMNKASCPTCGNWPNGLISHARFSYLYRRPVDSMIQKMKYAGVRTMADWMGRAAFDAAKELPDAYELIVPVPMDPKRARIRGGNHALQIALSLSKQSGQPCLCALAKVRNTPQQARLSARERHENLREAFSCVADVRGKRILLVDDVITTGATALSCAETLRKSGAMDVQFVAVSGAVRHNSPQQK